MLLPPTTTSLGAAVAAWVKIGATSAVARATVAMRVFMDCDTTGIEPDFALVKFKKLAGGGYFKIINATVPPALERLGYTPRQIEDIVRYSRGTGGDATFS